jgi:NTE family protein
MDTVITTTLDRCTRTLGVLLLLVMLCSACSTAHYAINAPQLAGTVPVSGYALRHLKGENNSDSLVVVLALSGGGYRAAALAHAVMAELANTPIRWEGQRRSLLDEVDVISAVSGGSLAAAYFALRPDHFVREFEQRVLAVDLQAALLQRALSPAGLWRQTSSTFGRGDLLQEVLDENIFHGRRFADIPRRRPMVHINATDMRHGQRFEFTQDQFDHLCSDLDAFPVSRAVAASMAVPVLLSPITVWNQRGHCPVAPELHPIAGQAASSRYIHLVDGGLADNTGLNALLDNVAVHGGLRRMARASGLVGVRKRVIFVVNAQVAPQDPEEDTPHTPGLVRQLRSLVNVPIDRHADTKVQHLSDTVRQWQAELRETGAPDGRAGPGGFHVIELNMSRARNPLQAEALQRIPSGLRIEPAQLAQIRAFVRDELASSHPWRDLLQDLDDTGLQASTSAPRGLRCEGGGHLCE